MTSDRLKIIPLDVVNDISILRHVQRGGSVNINYGHCGVSEAESHSGASMSNTGACKKGHNLEDNCSTKNMLSIASGFNSSLDCGVIKGVVIKNGAPRCPLVCKDYQHCPPITEENGKALAEQTNVLVATLNKLNVHVFVFTLAGPSSGILQNVMPYLDRTVCKHVCFATTHYTNFTVVRVSMGIER